MGILNRLRFLIGILLVIALAGALFLYLSYSMSHVTSKSATLETDAYSVSADYAGVLKKQYVNQGDQVEEGDELFEIESPTLTQAMKNDKSLEEGLLFDVTDDGNILLRADAPGTIRQIYFTAGSYIEANTDVATIATENTQYVTARYLLKAPDYARINRDNPIHVTLPDNTKLEAKVFDITLEQDEEQVLTVVKARFSDGSRILPTFSAGTPVSTSWQLNNSSWQDIIFRSLKSLVQPTSQDG